MAMTIDDLTKKYGGGATPTPANDNSTMNIGQLKQKYLAPTKTEQTSPTLYTSKKNNFTVTQSDVDRWASPDYKLSDEETKRAKEFNRKFRLSDVGISPYSAEGMDLETKSANIGAKTRSNLFSFTNGFAEGAAFVDPAKVTEKIYGKNDFTDTVKNTRNNTTYNVGKGAGRMADYALLQRAGLFSPISGKIGTALGGGVVANAVGNIASDTLMDIGLDTIPELVGNIKEGKSGKEITTDALKNIGTNVAFNLGGELLANGKNIVKDVKNAKADKLAELAKEADLNAFDAGKATRKANTENAFNEILENSRNALKDADVANQNDAIAKRILEEQNATKETDLGELLAQARREADNVPVESGDININELLGVPVLNAPNRGDLVNTLNPYELVGATERQARKANNAIIPSLVEDTKNVDVPVKSVAENTGISKANVANNQTVENAEKLVLGDTPEKAVSQTREKLVERGLATEEEAAKYYPKEDFTYDVTHVDRTVKSAITDVDNRGVEAVLNDIGKVPTDTLAPEEVVKLQYIYQSANSAGNYEVASRALRRLQQSGSSSGASLRFMQEWAKSSPEGALAYTLSKAKNSIDKKMLKGGYTDAVDNMADALTDAIKANDDLAIEKVLKSNLSDFSSGAKAKRLKNVQIDGQMSIFDFIKEEKAIGRPVNEIAEEAGRLLKKNAGSVSLTPAQEKQMLDYFTQMSSLDTDSYEYRQLAGKAMQILDAEMPTSLANQIRTTLYDNMLGNIKTALTRNAGGNLVGNALEKIQRPLKTGIDALTGKITGTRNYMLGKGVASEYGSGLKKGWSEQIADLKSGVNTTRSGQNSLDDALDAVKTAYKKDKNKLSKFLGKYDDAVKGVMTLGDRPFYEAEYAASKKELQNIADKLGADALQTAGLPDEALKKVDDTIEFLARDRALEAVYQNRTLTAESFTKLKEFMGGISEDWFGVDVLSQTASPFVQVPANMLSRTVEYSPIGILSNVIKTIRETATGNFNQKRFVDSLSRNLTGGLLLGGSAALAKAGGITGGYSDDPDKRKAQKDAGELEYALRLPNNTQIDVSDLPVLGPMLKAGSALNESLKNNESKIKGLGEGTSSALGTMLDTSMMQGLNRLLGSNEMYNSDNNFWDNAKNTVLSGLSQGVPALVRQASQTLDPYKRNLGEYGTGEYYLNNMLNSTPFRGLLDVKTDREGNPVMQNNGRSLGMKALENFILPYTISQPQYSEVTQEANRLFDNGEGAIGYIPNLNASELKSVKGFNEEDYSYDKLMSVNSEYSEKTSKDAKTLIASQFYKSLDDEGKANALADLYTAEKALLKKKVSREGKSESEIASLEDSKEIYTTNDTLVKKYEEGGINEVIKYMEMKNAFDSVGVDTSNKNAQEIYEKSGVEGLKEATSIAKQNGIEKLTADQWETYNKLGVDAFREKMQTAGALNNYGLKDNEFNREYYETNGAESLPVLAEAEETIKTIEKGVDKYGDPTYLGVGNATVNIYNQLGKEGLENYSALITTDVNGDGKIGNADRIPTLQAMNISNEEKGFLLSQTLGTLSEKAETALNNGGYADLYTMYVLKNFMSENDITKKEQIQDMLDNIGMSTEEKRYYFSLLSNAKNPY